LNIGSTDRDASKQGRSTVVESRRKGIDLDNKRSSDRQEPGDNKSISTGDYWLEPMELHCSFGVPSVCQAQLNMVGVWWVNGLCMVRIRVAVFDCFLAMISPASLGLQSPWYHLQYSQEFAGSPYNLFSVFMVDLSR